MRLKVAFNLVDHSLSVFFDVQSSRCFFNELRPHYAHSLRVNQFLHSCSNEACHQLNMIVFFWRHTLFSLISNLSSKQHRLLHLAGKTVDLVFGKSEIKLRCLSGVISKSMQKRDSFRENHLMSCPRLHHEKEPSEVRRYKLCIDLRRPRLPWLEGKVLQSFVD